MDKRDLFTVSEIANRSGFAASAIRFYESQGLITCEGGRLAATPSGRLVLNRLILELAA